MAVIAEQIVREIRSRLSFLQAVGLSYLTLSRCGRDALRRREPAHPPGHADRLEPHGRAVYPGRAVHRPAPARQRQAARHPAPPARPRQHRASSSSTTRTPCAPPTSSSTSAPARACTAARSSPPGTHRRRSWPAARSITGQYLSGAKEDPRARRAPRAGNGKSLTRLGRGGKQPAATSTSRVPARHLHLRDRRVRLGQVRASSTKSSIRSWPAELNRATHAARASSTRIEGLEHLDKVVGIDQSPIGRTPALQPRDLHRRLQRHPRPVRLDGRRAQARGYGPGRFSFNVKGGRCEACRATALVKIEMHFLRGRLRPLRGLPRQAVQPRDAGGPL